MKMSAVKGDGCGNQNNTRKQAKLKEMNRKTRRDIRTNIKKVLMGDKEEMDSVTMPVVAIGYTD